MDDIYFVSTAHLNGDEPPFTFTVQYVSVANSNDIREWDTKAWDKLHAEERFYRTHDYHVWHVTYVYED